MHKLSEMDIFHGRLLREFIRQKNVPGNLPLAGSYLSACPSYNNILSVFILQTIYGRIKAETKLLICSKFFVVCCQKIEYVDAQNCHFK